MAKLDIRGLNYITSSEKQSTFNIDFAYTDDGHIQAASSRKPSELSVVKRRTFFADIGEEDTMSQKYYTNIASLYDLSNGFIIHNIYDISKTKLKSNILINNDDNETLDIYVPTISSDFIDMCQFQTYAYALTERTNISPTTLSISFNNRSNIDYSYNYKYTNDELNTIMYRPFSIKYDDYEKGTIEKIINDSSLPEEIKTKIKTYQDYILSGGNQELSNFRISQIFDPVRRLPNIKYNYLIEVPESDNYNNYEDGHIFCNSFVCKNDLNYLYTMDITNNCHYLSSCRDYIGLGVCGGKMFMKYRTNISYYHNNSTDPQTPLLENNEILVRKMSEQTNDKYTYQHIEVVESLNRWDASTNGHKSNMYSIRLYDTGLNTTEISESIKEKLRQNIINNVRTMAEKICPANTQLFNIYFKGK